MNLNGGPLISKNKSNGVNLNECNFLEIFKLELGKMCAFEEAGVESDGASKLFSAIRLLLRKGFVMLFIGLLVYLIFSFFCCCLRTALAIEKGGSLISIVESLMVSSDLSEIPVSV